MNGVGGRDVSRIVPPPAGVPGVTRPLLIDDDDPTGAYPAG